VVPDGVRCAVVRVACGLLDLVLPDECRICERPLHELSRVPVCRHCLKQPATLDAEFFCRTCRTPFLNRYPLDDTGQCPLCRLGLNGFDEVYSAGSYEGNLRKLIHLFKFDGVQPLGRPLAGFLAGILPREQRFDVIVPMPLHWRRKWQRGFNQSELLAREIAGRWNVPVRNVVRRKRATTPQAGLTSAQRRKNVQGAFEAKYKARLDGQRVLLIDDVLTTGATASACARVLKRAGAARVSLLTLARRDRRAGLELQTNSLASAAGGSKA
jgi:ComF family protein